MGSNWQQGDRAGLALCPFNFPTGVYMSGDGLGHLKPSLLKRQARDKAGIGKEKRVKYN